MPDLVGGLDFARGLLETALPYHNQLKQKERDEEDRQREGMLSILSAALKSDSLDPRAVPLLLEKGLELQGAKGKDVKQYGDALRGLLSSGFDVQEDAPTGRTFGGSRETQTLDDGSSSERVTAPTQEMKRTNVRRPLFQSAEEVARREAQTAGEKERAVRTAREPFERADDERALERVRVQAEARASAARERARAQENMLIKRHGLKATEGIDALAAQIAAANPTILPEEAREQAGQRLNAKFDANLELLKAKVGFTNAAAGAIPQKLFFEGERVKQGWERVNQGWDGLTLREQTLALEEGYKTALVQMKGNAKKQQEYAAKARPFLDQIRQTEAQRASLERMIAGGLAVGDNVSNQVQAYADRLKTLRNDLQTLTNSYTGSLETPELKVTPKGARGRVPAAPSEGKSRVSRAKFRAKYPDYQNRSDADVDNAIRSAGYEPIP